MRLYVSSFIWDEEGFKKVDKRMTFDSGKNIVMILHENSEEVGDSFPQVTEDNHKKRNQSKWQEIHTRDHMIDRHIWSSIPTIRGDDDHRRERNMGEGEREERKGMTGWSDKRIHERNQ